MITREQTAMLIELHKKKEVLELAISDANKMKATNNQSYRDIVVETHDGASGRTIHLVTLLPPEEILELRDQIVMKLNDKLEDVTDELKSLIISKLI